jgi:hypothetical protein
MQSRSSTPWNSHARSATSSKQIVRQLVVDRTCCIPCEVWGLKGFGRRCQWSLLIRGGRGRGGGAIHWPHDLHIIIRRRPQTPQNTRNGRPALPVAPHGNQMLAGLDDEAQSLTSEVPHAHPRPHGPTKTQRLYQESSHLPSSTRSHHPRQRWWEQATVGDCATTRVV